MRRFVTAALAAGIGLAGGAAAAQGVAHQGTEFTLGYASWDLGIIFAPIEESGDTTLARVRTDWALGASFGVQANLEYFEMSLGDFDGEGTTTFALHPYYAFGTTGRAGLFFQRTDIEGGDDLDYTGLEGMFTPMPELAFEAYVGQAEADFLPDEVTSYGMTFHYALSDRIGMRVAYDREEISDGGFSANNSRFNIGLDYHIPGSGSFPGAVLTAEAGTVDLLGIVDVTVVGAKLTIPLGGTSGAAGRKLYRERGILWSLGSLAAGAGLGGPVVGPVGPPGPPQILRQEF